MSTPVSTTDPLYCDAQMAWARKEQGVAEIHHDYDISPVVSLYDPLDMLIAQVLCPNVSRNEALFVADWLNPVLQAEKLVISVDAHVTSQMINPKTGENWAPGEMQSFCNDDDGCSTGIITDTIFTNQVDRTGRARTLNRMYHVDHIKREVHWHGEADLMEEAPDGAGLDGIVVDAMRQSFRPNPALAAIDEGAKHFGVTPEAAQLLQKIAMTKACLAVLGHGAACALLGRDEAERDIIEASFDKDDRGTSILPDEARLVLRARYRLDDE